MAKHPAAHPFRNAGWVHLDEYDSLAPSSAKGSHVFQVSQGLSTAVAEESLNTWDTADDKPNNADESQEQASQVDIDWVRSLKRVQGPVLILL